MLRIAICDDEREAAGAIQGYLSELKTYYPDIFYEAFFSGEELLEHYQRVGVEEFYDIIFMDVEMGEINGLSTVTEIRKVDENPLVIYITSHDEYVYDSFETEPFNYLLKPVVFEDFVKVFKSAVIKKDKKNKTYTFVYNHEELRVYIEEILYFESQLYKIKLCTTRGDYTFNGALKNIYKDLQNHDFEYSHGSYLINLAHIHKLRYDKVILLNGVEIPVSPGRSKTIKEAYTNFKFRRCGL